MSRVTGEGDLSDEVLDTLGEAESLVNTLICDQLEDNEEVVRWNVSKVESL